MMKKQIFFCIACCLLLSFLGCQQAKEQPNPQQVKSPQTNKLGTPTHQKTTLAPVNIRASVPTNFTEVTFEVNNAVYRAVHRYNALEEKSYDITFTLISGEPISVDDTTFDPIVAEKTQMEFWDEMRRCNRLSTEGAVALCNKTNELTAVTDCGTYKNCTHCWMLKHCQ